MTETWTPAEASTACRVRVAQYCTYLATTPSNRRPPSSTCAPGECAAGHIADATGGRIRERSPTRVGLLGTRYTMEGNFYGGRLRQRHDLDMLIPDAGQRQIVHGVIYGELVRGQFRAASKDAYREIIADLAARGAQGVILGCTEIMLLIGQRDSPVPLFDTTTIHAEAAVDYALS